MAQQSLTPEARQHINWLHRGGAKGHLWGVMGDAKTSRWFDAGEPTALFNSQHHNYVGVHPCSAIPPTNRAGESAPPWAVRAQIPYIAAINCLFAEFDAKHFDGGKDAAFTHVKMLDPQPTTIIDSGGGYHCYWLFREPFLLNADADRARADRVQKGWVKRVRSDDGAKDLARVLRVPGTLNHKYDRPRFAEFVEADYSRLYTFDELEALLPIELEDETPPIATATADADRGRLWCLAALQGEREKMLAARDGERHSRRYASAFALGGLLHCGRIAEEEISNSLAVNFGHDRHCAEQTIRDGIRDGQSKPRAIPSTLQINSGQSKDKPDLYDAGMLWAQLYGEDWIYDQEARVWRWSGTHWVEERDGSPALTRQGADILRLLGINVSSTSRVDGCIRMAATYCARSLTPRSRLVNFRNGTLDGETMELRPPDRADGLTYCLPFDYAPGEWRTIEEFLEGTMPDREVRRAYMTHIGLSLLGDLTFHKVLLLLGPPRAGKSTVLQLSNATCGNDPFASAGPELFDRQTEGLRSRASWNGRPLVTIEELPVEALRNEELFKAMAAHAGVPQRHMFAKETTKNRWTPKLMMATNEAPRYQDRTGALTTRLIIASCPNQRSDDDLDLNLIDRLLTEIPAFAAACIDEAREALRIGRYPESPQMRALLESIEQRGDPMKAFVRDCCILEPDAFTSTKALWNKYKDYCAENGYYATAMLRFTEALTDRYRQLCTDRQRIKGTKHRGLIGIRLRSDGDPDPDVDDEGGPPGPPEDQPNSSDWPTNTPLANATKSTSGPPGPTKSS